jgi:hypothetical protein
MLQMVNILFPLDNQRSFLKLSEELPHDKEETINPGKACTFNQDKNMELSNKLYEVCVSHRVHTAHGPTEMHKTT